MSALLMLTLAGCVEPPRGWVLALYGATVDPDNTLLTGVEISVSNLETGALMGTVESSDDGQWYLPVMFEVDQEDVLFPIAISATSEGYEQGLTYAEAVLRDPLADYALYGGAGQAFQSTALRMPPVMLSPEGDAEGSGALLDATTGAAVPQARMILRRGYNAPDSRAIDGEVSTDADGNFAVSGLPGGVYTALIESFSGYALTRFPVAVVPGGRDKQKGLIVPPEGVQSFRVALTWDAQIAELDLHVTGPRAGSSTDTAGFHIWSAEPDHPPVETPTANMELFAEGLQSAVINEVIERGAYRFSGFDVSHADVSTSEALSESGALMQLWWDGEAWMETVSPNLESTLWRALELDPVNREVLRLQEYDVDVAAEDTLYF